MGASLSFATSPFRAVFRKRDMRMVMLGLDAVGKTTILYGLKLGEVAHTIPTIGMNVEKLEYAGARSVVSFTVWDVGGRSKIRALWRRYYQNCNSLIFVVDSNDTERLEEAKEQLHQVLEDSGLKDAPLLVFANKQDLISAMSTEELTERLGLRGLRGWRWHMQGCCALSKDGLREGLEWLAAELESEGKEGKGQAPSSAKAAPFSAAAEAKAVSPSDAKAPPGASDDDGGSDGSTAATDEPAEAAADAAAAEAAEGSENWEDAMEEHPATVHAASTVLQTA